jgi:WD40 repeat protein
LLNQLSQALVSGQFDCPDFKISTPVPEAAPESMSRESPSTTHSIRRASRSELSVADSAGGQFFRSVARIGRQAAEGLAYAHARGIIHRDVKPSNLLLDMAGVVWITDFGLAKTRDTSLTSTGDVVGTFRYMAPERFRGEGDERADVYGLGLTLYELLVLRPAFAERDRLNLIDQIKNEEPDRPRTLDRRIPRDLETIILKAIDKDAERRYPSAEALAEDLRRFLANEPIQARRTSAVERLSLWRRRNPAVASLLGVVFLLLICLTTGSLVAAIRLKAAEADRTEQLYQSLVAQAHASRFSRQVGQRYATLEAVRKAAALVRERHMPTERLDELRNLAIAALVLPDFRTLRTWEGYPAGSFIVDADDQLLSYARGDLQGNISLRWIDTDDEIAQLQTWPGVYDGLKFSPGGQFLATGIHSQVRIWDVSSLPPRTVHEGEQAGFCFHPDGRHVAIGMRNGTISILDLTKPKQPSLALKSSSAPHGFDSTGNRLAAIDAAGKVQILDAKNGKILSSLPELIATESLAWHPNGNYLALGCLNREIHVWDLKRMKLVSTLVGCRNGGISVAFTSDGDRLLSNGWECIIRVWDWRTGRQVLQHPGWGNVHCLAKGRHLIPEGSRLKLVELTTGHEYRSFVQQSNAGNYVDNWGVHIHPEGRLFVVAMSDGARLFDLESGEDLASLPAAGFGSIFQGKEALLTDNADGLFRWPIQVDQANPNRWRIGPPKRLHVGTGFDICCDKEGSVIGQPTGMGAYLVRPGKGILFIGPHADGRFIHISSDGKYAVTGNHGSDEGAKVWNTETGQLLIRFPTGNGGAAFSPDGKWLSIRGSRGCRLVKVGTWEERAFDTAGRFAPDSSFLVAGANPGLIRLLDPETGRELAQLADPNQNLPQADAFTPDGGKLLDSNNLSRAIHVWDLRAIRAQLAEMDLDWDSPPLPPAPPPATEPLQVQIDLGDFKKLAEVASLVRQANRSVRANKHQDALTALRKAVQIAPSHAEAHNNLAWLLLTGHRELRDPEQALSAARKAVELDRDQSTYLNTLGVALYRCGRFSEAVPVLERSLREGRGESDAFDLFFLAMCHHRLGGAAKGKECRDRADDWFQEHKNQLTSFGWVQELTEFQAEAHAVLKQPPGQARK